MTEADKRPDRLQIRPLYVKSFDAYTDNSGFKLSDLEGTLQRILLHISALA